MRTKILYLISFILFYKLSFSQDLNFFHYGLEDGISQQTIRCILKDSKGFLWLGTQDGLNRFDGHVIKVFKPSAQDSTSIHGKFINDIIEAKDGTIWIATANKGVCYYNPNSETFVQTSKNTGNCTSLVSDENSNVYATFQNRGFTKFSKDNGIYTSKSILNFEGSIPSFTSSYISENQLYLGTSNGRILKSYIDTPFQLKDLQLEKSLGIIQTLQRVTDSVLLIGSAEGLYELNSGTLKHLNLKQFNINNTENLFIESLTFSNKDLYVGTDNGLFILKDYLTKGFDRSTVLTFKGDKNFTNTITSNRIYDILVDEDLLWIGTNNLDVATLNPPIFKTINTKSYPAISNNYVFSILTTDEYTFIGTRDGLNCIDKSNTIYHITKENTNRQLSYNVIRGMCVDADRNLWLATTKGVSVIDLNGFDPKSPKIKSLYFEEHNPMSLSNNKTRSVYLDHNNNIWVTTYGGGINRFTGDIKTNTFTFQRFKKHSLSNSISSDFTFHINQDQDNTYWITSENGLNRLNFESSYTYTNPKFKTYNASPGTKTGLQNNITLHTLIDSENQLWVSTQNGLHLYNRDTDNFKSFTEKQGLSNTYVYGIVEDAQKMLWLSTNDGLYRFDKGSEKFTHFTVKDGVQSTEFNLGAHHYNPIKEQVYFGGVNGFNVFSPRNIKPFDVEGKLTLTELQINNKIINPLSRNDVLKSGITTSKEITLKHRDFPCKIEFSDLDLRPQKNIKFLYRLNSKDWNYTTSDQTIQLVNLPKGTHELQIQGQTRGEFWNKPPLKLRINVIPPWYKSNFAYVIYFLFFFLVVSAFYKISFQRQLVAQESRRLQDLDALKSKFITNITHEFRTPLTLIMGYTTTLREKLGNSISEKRALESIEQSSTLLLTLVNDMMALAQLEQGKLSLKNTKQDIVRHTKYLTDSFKSLTAAKDVKLDFYSDRKVLVMDYDVEKFRQIITNLISNSIKFSESESTITINLISKQHHVLVEVIDQGKGVSAQDLPFIFDRFYQSEENSSTQATGSGVGLALTKELVELMKGKIDVKSTYGLGTTFSVTLPILNDSELKRLNFNIKSDDTKNFKIQNEVKRLIRTSHPYSILLVEDNTDIALYIETCLEKHYNLTITKNGIEGLEKAKEMVPDIIITDLMMPKMDGYELTRSLQDSDTTSHIPIIILTAKGQQEDRLKSLKMGADVFLSKPFKREELLLRIEKLIEKRKQLQKHYQSENTLVKKHLAPKTQDKNILFLNKAIALIHDNITDSSFNAEQLSREMALSESQLYRKLKAITNYSTAIFIRNVRLEKARELLETTTKSVSEIAFETGFNDPNWFGKVYKSTFGDTPSAQR